jgi:hypothetical protein
MSAQIWLKESHTSKREEEMWRASMGEDRESLHTTFLQKFKVSKGVTVFLLRGTDKETA